MKTYLISYDLRIPESSEDYKILINKIKTYPNWAKPLKSVWFVKTSKTASKVRDDLRSVTDFNDGLLVIEITRSSDWATYGIDKEVTDWMHENI